MPTIVTLITDPSKFPLTQRTAIRASAAISARDVRWLADNEAVELTLDDNTPKSAIGAALAAALGPDPVDVAVQTTQDCERKKKILIADMDSTMIRQECIDELAAEAGLKDRVAAITARAMNGEIEFEAALRERVGLLEGLPTSVIDKVISTRIELMPGGIELVRTMRKNGAFCALVSGGFTDFTSRIAQMIGFQENRANRLLQENGKLTGKVAEPILGKQAKVDALNDIASRLNLSVNDAVAVGDGANDLGMLDLAGTGVALHAKPSVAAQADIRIDHGDLTALLFLQGYRRAEFSD